MDAVFGRHAACGDDGMEMLAADEPLAILRYLLSRPDVPRNVRAADAADAVTMVRHLHADLADLERRALRLAKDSGLTWEQVAAVRRGSPQAAHQRLRRLEEAKDEVAAPRSEAAWLAHNAGHIERTARAVAASALPVIVQSDADDLDEALAEDDPGPAELMSLLRPVVKGLAATGGLWCLEGCLRDEATALVAAWDRVRDGKAA